MPIAALAMCFVVLGVHGTVGREKLHPHAYLLLGAEMTAIFVVGVVRALDGAVRWY